MLQSVPLNELIARSFYRRRGVPYLPVEAKTLLELVWLKWNKDYEPFELVPSKVFPWLEVLEFNSEEYSKWNELIELLKYTCLFFTEKEYREKRDMTFRGKDNVWYVIPRFTFTAYHERCLRRLAEYGNLHCRSTSYPDYKAFFDRKTLSVSKLDRVAPNEFFAELYRSLGVTPSSTLNLFKVFEEFGVIPKQEAGKKPRYPLLYIEELLKKLYADVRFLSCLVPEEDIVEYD